MEIRRLFRAKNFFLGIVIASCGLFFGASYPDGEALKKLLEAGHFLEMEAKAFSSRPFLLLLPIAAVLPWSDSFLLEKQGGFLKSALPRTGRRYYVESKVFTTSLGGFLAVLFAGIFVCFAFFTVFFPREAQGKIAADSFVSLLFLILRSSLLGGILASFGGICGGAGKLGLSGSWTSLCQLLFLCDSSGPVFQKSFVALSAPVGGGQRQMGRKRAWFVDVSASVSWIFNGSTWRNFI